MATRSNVWSDFEKINKSEAKCNICKSILKFNGGCTSGLKRHSDSKHPTVSLPSPSTSQQKMPTFTAKPVNKVRADVITDLVADVIADCMLPVSIVDSKAFTKLLNFLEPNYALPCRQTMTIRLREKQTRMKDNIKSDITNDINTTVSLTSDIWTSLANEAYLSVTANYINADWQLKTPVLATFPMEEKHTGAYIAQSLISTCNDWDITKQVLAVVHDGAANMKEAGNSNGWLDVGCAAHKLHLVVTSAMRIDKTANTAISRCVGAASRLVGHFSHSPTATNELLKRQRAMDSSQEPRKLIQHVKTRWNSVCDMFARLLDLRWPVVACLSDRTITKLSDAKTLDMKEEHWELMSELLPLLKKLQMCTALFSVEKAPSAATVYPTLWKLVNTTLSVGKDDPTAVVTFKVAVSSGLKQRFDMEADNIAKHPIIVCSMYGA